MAENVSRELWLHTMKPLTVTLIFNLLFTGVNISGASSYMIASGRSDKLLLKLLVAGMIVFNGVSTIGLVLGTWEIVITEAGDYMHLQSVPTAYIVCNFSGFQASMLAQFYYVYRTYSISRQKWVLFVSLLLMAAPLGCYITQAVFRAISMELSARQQLAETVLAYFWTALASEAWLAGTFLYWVNKSRQGFNSVTDAILVRLARCAIEASFLTVLMGFIGAVMFMAKEDSLWFSPFYTNIGQSYAFAVLYSLNQRQHVKELAEMSAEETRKHGVTTRDPSLYGGPSQINITISGQPRRLSILSTYWHDLSSRRPSAVSIAKSLPITREPTSSALEDNSEERL